MSTRVPVHFLNPMKNVNFVEISVMAKVKVNISLKSNEMLKISKDPISRSNFRFVVEFAQNAKSFQGYDFRTQV